MNIVDTIAFDHGNNGPIIIPIFWSVQPNLFSANRIYLERIAHLIEWNNHNIIIPNNNNKEPSTLNYDQRDFFSIFKEKNNLSKMFIFFLLAIFKIKMFQYFYSIYK